MKRDVFAYELRAVSPDPVAAVAGYRIKPYRIAHPGAAERCDVEPYDQRRLLADRLVPAVDDRWHGLGFSMLHTARDGTYLLIGRWYDGNNLMSESYRVTGPADAPRCERLELFACIWEMAVYLHERQAWVATTMASGRGLAAAEEYLQCRFSGWV
ncbi:MAG: hypothetical protein JSR59_01695 [Proteobacteria bacterium]|nr:hypothetical protein [Pseudomonadota bacterium]